MKKLLIITHNQFGYQISHYKYAHSLKKFFHISYISLFEGKNLFNIDGIQNEYVKKFKNPVIRYIYFVIMIIHYYSQKKYELVLIKYFPFCSLMSVVLPRNKIILDIRSVSVSNNLYLNFILDSLLRLEAKYFSPILTLSTRLKKRLKLKNCIIVPLGSDTIGYKDRNFNKEELKLIYIGSFDNRRLSDTVIGLGNYLKEYPAANLKYTIIGDGQFNEKKRLFNEVRKRGLSKYVEITTWKSHEELEELFQKHNIGISYIPITEYFDIQPPTKTYEYLMSGLPVIATATSENKKIISDKNGILIDDTPASFTKGLAHLHKKLKIFSSREIAKSVKEYQWENIVDKKLLPVLKSNLL